MARHNGLASPFHCRQQAGVTDGRDQGQDALAVA
jgi:hypothetical protein